MAQYPILLAAFQDYKICKWDYDLCYILVL